MSDDDTRPIPAEEPTKVETARAEVPRAQAPTTPLPPVPPLPTEPAASTGHIRVTSATPQPAPEPRATLRVGTVVWGLVIAAVGIGLLSVAWGAHLDAELALIVLLGAAGVALLVGSLAGMRRSRSRMEGRG